MIKKLILFLLLNFGALAIGSIFTSSGVASTWYQNLPKAPWTPPGWVFGAAWTLIMVCFSVYMASLAAKNNSIKVILLFAIQWLLNVSWNPVFFYFKEIVWGLVIIVLLTFVVHIFLIRYLKTLRWKTVFIVPYAIWIVIATSLNLYIFLKS